MPSGKYVRKPLTAEHKKNIGLANLGKHHTRETKKQISEIRKRLFKEGKLIPFIQGKHWSEEIKNKISNSEKGKKISKEICKKISKSLTGRQLSKVTREKMANSRKGENNNMYGKHHTQETRKKMCKAIKKIMTPKHRKELSEIRLNLVEKGLCVGENHPNWQGGISFEPYGIEFNNKLKKQARTRDNYTCQECGFNEEQLGKKLDVHHIDFNKKNNQLLNLISLCKSCHTQTQFNRQNWINYFQNKLKQTNNGKKRF